MKYLGAITDNNDLVTKGYVDEQAVDYAQIYDSLSPDLQQKLEDDYGFDRDMFISEAGTALGAAIESAYQGSVSAVYTSGTRIATVGGVDIYVPVYNGGVS